MTGALSTDLRKQLESAIKEARRVAEPGARKALEALAVDRARAHESMSAAEQALRKRLRAHGRQLGDVRDPEKETQETRRLAREVAYEHWHRMLFARFLAENQLLIEPTSGVAISMAECDELARELGEDPWAFAGRAAARMLPRVFRPDDPALEVALAPETRLALERLLESLPAEVFTADDSLGWTYQFWQAERKDEVNASGVKIGADELPAVTQLFTEHYMVLFLFHNTIGAWRAGRLLAERPELAREAASEDELRRAVRLEAEGGYDFDYLRFVRAPEEEGEAQDDAEREPTGPWRSAAGAFEGWPRRAAELRVLDPCCGSGHFLVEGLGLLVRLRMEEEEVARDDAIRAVLAENLFGLELDPRCTQIAAFNLALAAWKLAGRPIELPPLQIACSGLAIGASKPEWLALAGGDERLRGGMARLYELFQKAPELGSLIDPHALKQDQQDLLAAELPDLEPLLAAALEREGGDEAQVERAVAAQGMARAAGLLADTYTLIITNVPYLGRGNQTATLKKFAEEHHPEAKADLATMFVSRAFRWLGKHGTQAVVTPQNWLFLASFSALRKSLLTGSDWCFVAKLGPNAFRDMNWWAAVTSLVVLRKSTARCTGRSFSAIDVGDTKDQVEKAQLLCSRPPIRVSQDSQLANDKYVVSFQDIRDESLLSEFADSVEGLSTGDGDRFRRKAWEVVGRQGNWSRFHIAPDATRLFHGCSELLFWQDGTGELARSEAARIQGNNAWGRSGILVGAINRLKSSLFTGAMFDKMCIVVIPKNPRHIAPVWAFCTSDEFYASVRKVTQKVHVATGSLLQISFDLARWQKVAAEKYPKGLPEPYSDDPTQWLFHGHPTKAEPEAALQVTVARLLGYRWPPEHDAEMHLADEARAWAARCGELAAFADDAGIVCLPALRGEAGAADRLRKLLAAAFGGAWSGAKERELLAAAAGDGKAAESLEEWLRERFFEEHCKRFHHRPFVWHVWDGRHDGFHALVSYHRLAGPGGEGRRTLEALTYSYLGDWIARQKAEQREGREGADARLAAAQDLQAQLERILAGEPPCDLFVRWKPLHRQPIGWEPDLDDGVRLNIRPFLRAELRIGGRKGAGLLRWNPKNIKWSKDRGKEPQSLRPREDFPWFWSCAGEGSDADRTDFTGGVVFDGNRWNDLHYTTAAKRAARERVGGEDGG
jgi:hypothetical protein